MNRKMFSVVGLIFLSILLFGAGVWFGQAQVVNANRASGWMMGNRNEVNQPGYGMMGGSGMMNGQYGNMMGSGMMSMMMGGVGNGMMNGQHGSMRGNWEATSAAEISVTAAEATVLAQAYLDNTLPGTTAADHAGTFPGYYTLHIEQDGEVIGMLSVNAYTGDVFLHHWHGDLADDH